MASYREKLAKVEQPLMFLKKLSQLSREFIASKEQYLSFVSQHYKYRANSENLKLVCYINNAAY